ncbi:MAG TPA: UbiA family prenyltransferase [Pontiellaceae bacterium]|nr:UbiA family prenyltransferase [Pontiellaceae bacterium]
MTKPLATTLCPLCVDLDGTLVKTDTFAQEMLLLIRTRPLTFFYLLRRISAGLAPFKQRIAGEIQLDPAALPYQFEFLELLKEEYRTGRELILVTASDKAPAQAVAEYLGLFSDVMASNGVCNLKATRKRDALVARFGEKGFDYAGNAVDDLPVWAVARNIIAVNPSTTVLRALANRSARVFEDRPPLWRVWLRALRVHQWTKNMLIFLPMLLAHELTNPVLYLQAVIAFFSFSLAASTIYIFNDIFDLHADQHHPHKKKRPFASGNLGLGGAVVVMPLLLISFLLAALLSPTFIGILLLYLALTTLYSWWLKQTAVLDVLTLAGLYALRIFAGTAAYGVVASEWLIAFSIFIFLSLALVKRYAELRAAAQQMPDSLQSRGRGYRVVDMPLLGGFGVATGCLSVLVLALYISSPRVIDFYPRPAVLWLLCPLQFYWIARIWLLAGRGEMSDDPLDFAARDLRTWLVVFLSSMTLVLGSF